MNLDTTDARLLDLLQSEFPLVPRPFDALGEKLGIRGDEVTGRIIRLKADGIIRQISAIFDSAALGYSSELVAFRTEPGSIDDVAMAVSAHKGVSHCYSRDAEYNLWFTITVGPEQDLTEAIERLAAKPGVHGFIRLPQTRRFKIGVFLGMAGENEARRDETAQNGHRTMQDRGSLDPRFEPYVRVLQQDLPISPTPFSDLADRADLTESELLSAAQELISIGAMRRFAAVLKHVSAGFKTNAMVCWAAAESEIERAGSELAKHSSVSHCYQRATSPDWPWPLYTMIHCRTESELEQVIDELRSASGLSEYRVLRTVKEYKKARVTYFD